MQPASLFNARKTDEHSPENKYKLISIIFS